MRALPFACVFALSCALTGAADAGSLSGKLFSMAAEREARASRQLQSALGAGSKIAASEKPKPGPASSVSKTSAGKAAKVVAEPQRAVQKNAIASKPKASITKTAASKATKATTTKAAATKAAATKAAAKKAAATKAAATKAAATRRLPTRRLPPSRLPLPQASDCYQSGCLESQSGCFEGCGDEGHRVGCEVFCDSVCSKGRGCQDGLNASQGVGHDNSIQGS